MHNDNAPQTDALARKPQWRALAVVLWAGFLGAVLLTPAFIWATSQHETGIGLITRLFIASWLACCATAAITWLLAPNHQQAP